MGGFQNLIFGVSGSLRPDCRTAEHSETLSDKLIDFIEQHEICTAGGCNNGVFSFVFDHCKRPPHNITPEQRQMIIDWFVAQKEVQHLHANQLMDGFYSSDAEFDTYSETYK